MPEEEEAWGEFKSTTGQGDSSSFGDMPAVEGIGDDGHSGEEPSSAAPQQRTEAGEAEPEAGGGKEDPGPGRGTLLSPGGLAAPQQSAAERPDEPNEFKTGVTAAARAGAVVMAGEPATGEAPEEPRRLDDEGDGGVDLMNLLPSPTTVGATAAVGGSGGGVGGVGGGGSDMDLFGSMLASPAITEIAAVADAAAADPDGGLVGAGGKEQSKEEEWGVFEQPGPPAVAGWSGHGGSPPAAATPTPAAEKVDGEWIDLLGSGSDLPEGKNEGSGSVGGDDGDGAEQTLAVSDSGTAAVDRVEHEPEPRLDMPPTPPPPQSPQQEQLGGDDRDSESGRGSLVEHLGWDNGGGGGGGVTGAALGDSSKFSAADEKPADKPEHPGEGLGDEIDPQEEESLATAPPQSSESETPGDVAGATATAAVCDAEVLEFEPPLPAAAAPETAVPSEGGSDGGNLFSIGKNDGSSATPDISGAAAANILDWGGFGDPTPAVEAMPAGGVAAAPSGSAQGDEDREAEGEGERGQGGDEWSAFEAPPTPSPPQDRDPFENLPKPAADPAEGGAEGDSRRDGRPESPPPAPEKEADEPVGSPTSGSEDAGDGAGARSQEPSGAAVAPVAATGGGGGFEAEEASRVSPEGNPPASGPGGGDEEEAPSGDDEEEEEPPTAIPELEAAGGDGEGEGSSSWGAFDEAPPAAAAAAAAAAETLPPSEGGRDGGNLLGIGENGGSSATPDNSGAAAADTVDWGDFGNPSPAVEAIPAGGVAAAPSGSAQGEDDKEAEEEWEKGQEDDEWSAFEAPPTPSPPQDQHPFENLPQPAADPAEGGAEGDSRDGGPESPPPAPEKEADEPVGSPTSASRDAGDGAGARSQEPSGAAVAPVAATGGGGGFETEEASRVSPEGKPPASGPDGGDGGEVPSRDNEEEEEPPTAIPELEATGGDGEGEGSSSWGAFDEAPPAAAAAAAAVAAAAEVGGGSELEVADEDAPKEAEMPPDAAGEVPEAEGEVQEEGNSGGGQEPESEDDWGSDFGDFEEAPTPQEPEPAASGAASTTTTAPPKIAAFLAPPAADARSPPAAAAAVGGAVGAAAVSGETRDATADPTLLRARVAAGGNEVSKEVSGLLSGWTEECPIGYPTGRRRPVKVPRPSSSTGPPVG